MRIHALLGCAVLAVMLSVAAAPAALVQAGAFPMPVRGRIDHLAFDAARHRLYVAALGNNTVEVFDTSRNPVDAHIRSLDGFREPQGIAVVPDLDAVAVANGGSGTLQLLNADTFEVRWKTAVGGDADNVRYDPRGKRLLVAVESGLVVVDPSNGAIQQRIAIAGHPESFQLEPDGSRAFVNLPDADQVVVADPKSGQVTLRWPTGQQRANYPMAFDSSSRRLFVGFRQPARLALQDADGGKVLVSVDTVGDTDDLFYDVERHRVYVIGGEGFVDVVARDGDSLRRLAKVPTRPGARTGLWVAAQHRLYVARPARGSAAADVLIFEAQD